MSSADERYHAVLLHGRRVGTLCQRGDHTRFSFSEAYLEDPDRPVLGLRFEENLRSPYSSALRLPKWFSNLLPEGPLREWIAHDRGVSLDREMELLAQVGHDLPGAVQVVPADGPDGGWDWVVGDDAAAATAYRGPADSPWRFSLAGVALKFSMLAQGDRLTVPAVGVRGDWLVKFPDFRHDHVPRNEFTIMSLAGAVGIDVPEVRLVHRDELGAVPSRMWPNREVWAYGVRRFDRRPDDGRAAVHIEDFAQVRDKYPQEKYEGNFESVAAVAYRRRDHQALNEAVRRIAFCLAVGNGDAHLKNWSLIYHDRRVPTLSPAYDLVSTTVYAPADDPDDFGLRFGDTKRFEDLRLTEFRRLRDRLNRRLGGVETDLAEIAAQTVELVRARWPRFEHLLDDTPELRRRVGDWIRTRSAALLGSG